MKTYQFEGFFVTTDVDLSDRNPIAEFDVSETEVQQIEQGANLAVVEGELNIIEDIKPELLIPPTLKIE